MSTDDLANELTRRTENAPQELLTRAFFFFCAVLSIVTTVAIIVLLTTEAAKFFSLTASLLGVEGQTVSLVDFFTGTTWQTSTGEYGVLPLVAGTLMVVIGSAIIALPLGVGTAIYLSEYASPRLRSKLKPALEILAGIPTVVYGFFALIYITPALGTVLPDIAFFNMASAAIVTAMVSPIARESARMNDEKMPEAAAGTTTPAETSNFVAPSP